MGKSNASTRRWLASGPTASNTARLDTGPRRCHTGSSTTTQADRTAHSETDHPSAAFTTSVGRTASRAGLVLDRDQRPDRRVGPNLLGRGLGQLDTAKAL